MIDLAKRRAKSALVSEQQLYATCSHRRSKPQDEMRSSANGCYVAHGLVGIRVLWRFAVSLSSQSSAASKPRTIYHLPMAITSCPSCNSQIRGEPLPGIGSQ